MIKRRAISRFVVSENGHTAIEYAVVLGIGMVVLLTVIQVGQSVKSSFSNSGATINAATATR